MGDLLSQDHLQLSNVSEEKLKGVALDDVNEKLFELASNCFFGSEEGFDDDNRDYNTAFALFYYLAVNSDVDSQFFIGWMYENGLSVKQDYCQAVKWYDKASLNKDYNSTVLLANLYEQGLGVKKDFVKAADLYNKAINYYSNLSLMDFGDFIPEIRLARLYENGLGVERDLNKAVSLYSEYAGRDDVSDCLFRIANMYKNGDGVEKDLRKAIDIFSIVANYRNDGNADFEIAQIFSSDEFDGKDLDESTKWYEYAGRCGHILARKKLIKIYECSADFSDDESVWFDVGRKFDEGKYVDKDNKKAIKWYEKAAERNNIDAQYKLGYLYVVEEKDYINGIKWLKKASDFDNQYALYELGKVYLYGLGVTCDVNRAIENFKKSAMKGNFNAINMLFDMFYNGESTVCDFIFVKNILEEKILINYSLFISFIFNIDVEKCYMSLSKWNIIYLKNKVDNYFGNLGIKEQEVLKFRFGLEDGTSKTLEEVAKFFNVTCKRVRLIELKARRYFLKKRDIRNIIDDCRYEEITGCELFNFNKDDLDNKEPKLSIDEMDL